MPWQDSDVSGGKVRLKHSAQASEALGASGLVPGEVALNTADGKLYYKKPDGTNGFLTSIAEPPSDNIIYGRRNASWVDVSGPANLQVNRGTSSQLAAYTPLSGEPVWDTTQKRLFVGDGQTAGGIPVGYPVVVGTVPSSPSEINSSEFLRPVSVSLSPANSLWHVVGTYAIQAIDTVSASMVVKPCPTGVRSGTLIVRRKGTQSTTTYIADPLNAASETVTLQQFANFDDNTILVFDYIVQVSSSTLTWGLEFRSSASSGLAGSVGFADSDLMYARRLA